MFIGIKYSRRHCLGLLAIACTGLLGASCMLSPNDGNTVASRESARVSFGGEHVAPNKVIRVQSFNPVGSNFETIGTAISSSTSSYSYDGVTLFSWSVSVDVPRSHWQPGRTGHFARLRSLDSDDFALYTFSPSWVNCLYAHPSLGDFIDSCRSPRSPEVFLYTADFLAGVDLVLENIRLVEEPAGPMLKVRVRNQGRHGKVMGLECSHLGSAVFKPFNDPLVTGKVEEFDHPIATAVGQTVVCTVFGASEDGMAEVPIDNNTRTQVLP